MVEEHHDSERPFFQFAHISPHHVHISIRVRVIFVLESAHLAIVQDASDDFALYKYSEPPPHTGDFGPQHVTVAPRRIYTQTVLNLIAANCDLQNIDLSDILGKAKDTLLVLTQDTSK